MSVTLKCPKHPRYKALRKPRADCFCCRHLWATVHTIDDYTSFYNLREKGKP